MGYSERLQLRETMSNAVQTLMGNQPRETVDERTLTCRQRIGLSYAGANVSYLTALMVGVIDRPSLVIQAGMFAGLLLAVIRYNAGIIINQQLKTETKGKTEITLEKSGH